MFSPSLESKPSAPNFVDTTGTPAAIASRIFKRLPPPTFSGTTAAIGATAAGDYGRYKNPAADSLLDQFGATTDQAKQHDLIKQVEAFMLEDVPVIPVTEGVAWYQYSTKDFAGWPTPEDPYAAPAPWNLPDWEVVLLHVYKTS